ncbi:MAG: prepilin peptidase, partial [Anaerolineales bacterium]|nr:prepilin peptidase [Anaerolineales bacterium]
MFIPVLTGLALGWLVNYLADVLPHTLRLGRPLCLNPDCGAAFHWMDYLLLRGCPKCARSRRLRTYVLLILTAAISIYIWLSPPRQLGFSLGSVVLTYLLLVAVIDLEHRLILRPLSIAGLIMAALMGIYVRGWQSTLLGGAAGFGIMYLFYLLGVLFTRWRAQRMLRARRLGKAPPTSRDNADSEPPNYGGEEALGSGDVTLAAILGLLLGWPLIWFGLLLGILFSGVIGLIIILALLLTRRYKTHAFNVFIPYGPFFILSTFLLIYFPMW